MSYDSWLSSVHRYIVEFSDSTVNDAEAADEELWFYLHANHHGILDEYTLEDEYYDEAEEANKLAWKVCKYRGTLKDKYASWNDAKRAKSAGSARSIRRFKMDAGDFGGSLSFGSDYDNDTYLAYIEWLDGIVKEVMPSYDVSRHNDFQTFVDGDNFLAVGNSNLNQWLLVIGVYNRYVFDEKFSKDNDESRNKAWYLSLMSSIVDQEIKAHNESKTFDEILGTDNCTIHFKVAVDINEKKYGVRSYVKSLLEKAFSKVLAVVDKAESYVESKGIELPHPESA